MEITYESVCRKLGFDPIKDADRINEEYEKTHKNSWFIDDSQPNPYSVLTDEEETFLMNYIIEYERSQKSSKD